MSRPRFKAVSIGGATKGETEGWYVLDRAYCHRIVGTFPHVCDDPQRQARDLTARLNDMHNAHLEELR